MAGLTFERFSRGLTENLETPVRTHLKNVYATFTLATIAAAAGGYAHMFSTLIGAGLMTGLGAIGALIWLTITPYDGKNQLQRLSLLGAFAFLTGCNLGPLLSLAVMVNPALVLQALLGTSVVFACFSLSALYAPRGHYLYLGGTLMSALSTLFWLSMLNFFFGSRLLFQANLYIGLAVMCGFIVYDTQLIVEKARRGDKDYVMHSVELFIDFVAVFKRLLIILTDKEAQSKRKNRD
ncbi:probable Bax inhibitor 1 [Penaeus vannamei]|uniref:Putative bax inhibitor 1 isoform X1 n=1 Tax=Penaeus vannamei TaxID=6689 RepID=A0A423SGR1_PENVA|nr:probable Bax inhibitor 1 [Penaeus vannamei]ROT63396.1 putative bax inhibitor 1 isoform X1 [Penaeus vannamei]